MKPNMYNPAVLLLLMVYSVSSEGGSDDTISCKSQGRVLEGDQTAVACNYHQNLQNDRQDFYIYRSQHGQEPVIVAICAWEKTSPGLSCDLKGNYSVSVNASEVTLNITSARPFHAGKYSCSTLPPTPNVTINSCNLTVQETAAAENKVRAFCSNDGQEASVMCVYPDSMHTCTVIIERHDLRTNTEPVEVMRCDAQEETCTSSLTGYQPITNSQASDSFNTVGVTIPSYAADKSGFYVCKTDSESIASDMCTLESVQVSTRQDPEADAIRLLVLPLYAILVCLVLFVILALTYVIKRYRERHRHFLLSRDLDQQTTPLNHQDLNTASRV